MHLSFFRAVYNAFKFRSRTKVELLYGALEVAKMHLSRVVARGGGGAGGNIYQVYGTKGYSFLKIEARGL